MSGKIVKSKDLEKTLGSLQTKSNPPAYAASEEGGVIRKEEIVAQSKAQQLIARAEADADQIRKEATALKERIGQEMETAKKRGYEEGKRQGHSEMTEEVAKAKALQEKFFKDAEPKMIKLVLSIAEKVIGEMVSNHKEAIHSIVTNALERSLGDKILVKLNSHDYKNLKETDMQFKELLDRTRQLNFREDDAIQLGGCVVVTEIGTIDATLDTQMKAIKKAFGV
ncbi:MAG: FliH/SctL family protein [Deltaproteobacteria bacterium]|nr:FliH/SctL family protein [Deltaproteobacteria bacterium]